MGSGRKVLVRISVGTFSTGSVSKNGMWCSSNNSSLLKKNLHVRKGQTDVCYKEPFFVTLWRYLSFDDSPPGLLHLILPVIELTPYRDPSNVDTNSRCSWMARGYDFYKKIIDLTYSQLVSAHVTKQVSISAPSHSKGCFCFDLGECKELIHTARPAITGIRIQVLAIASPAPTTELARYPSIMLSKLIDYKVINI